MRFDTLTFILRENWPQLVTGLILPLGVGLLTKLRAHPAVYALVNVVLSLLSGAVEAVAMNGGVVDIEQICAYFIAIFGVSHVSYKAIWKPIGGGVADPARLATADSGLGAPVAPPGGRAT